MKPASARLPDRSKRGKASSSELSGLRRLIRTVEKKLRAEITGLRHELRSSEIALAAARLRTLNERQTHEGLVRLRADLVVFRDLGIADEQGERVRKEFPAELLEDTSDVV